METNLSSVDHLTLSGVILGSLGVNGAGKSLLLK